ncbi:MAG TPA: DUF3592 domain-containing protein [Pyrinomonadaceae bacterium]
MEFILEFIPARLLAFLIAVAFIAAGVYVWRGGSNERALYDAAVGAGSKTIEAEIRYKTTRSERSSGINDHDSGSVDVDYLQLSYEEGGKYKSLDARVDRDEFNAVKEGDDIKVSFHPDNPEYIVTPMKTRPSVIWHRLGGGVLIGLGAIFILMILVSFAGD